MKTISQIGEIPLIRKIGEILNTKDPFVLCGIGDDAAVIKFGNKKLLFKTDALLESVHFDWRYADPFLLGRKSLSINLSDIAAMGGKPRWAILSIALPARESLKKAEEFFRGLKSCADEFGVSIVGGDTDRSLQGWKVTIALIGEVENPIYRRGAKVGDRIWVTGFLGCSALGLEMLKREDRRKENQKSKFVSAHLDPPPRVREGEILSKNNLATSLIDISDGLLLDLEHLCLPSKVGAQVERKALPFAEGFLKTCRTMKKDPHLLAMSGGEDYELLFTASPRKSKTVESVFRKLGTKVTCIGEVVGRSRGIQVLGETGRPLPISKKGYQHF